MKKLIIRNVGPINDVNIDFKKINVIIGPQSSGKSTIAKILSFCLWLEKDIVAHQDKDYINASFLQKQLLEYHKIENYLSDNSTIIYESINIKFSFHTINDFNIICKEEFKYATASKVAYIPSERNLVAISNISSLDMGENYVRDFLFNWLVIHTNFGKDMTMPIMDLGAKFYYDLSSNKDRLVLDNGKEIDIDEASSGMQSVIPMLVYLYYVTRWIYNNDTNTSFDKYSVIRKTYLKKLSPSIADEVLEKALASPELMKMVNNTLLALDKLKNESLPVENETLYSISQLIKRISKPHFTSVIIEEPEQNLFPKTQYELVKSIIGMLDIERGDCLLITTHSPYIMTSLNNLIQAGNVIAENKKQKSRVMEIYSEKQILNYTDVGAWTIENGLISSIMDDDFNLISATSLDSASDIISADFEKMV